MLCTNSTVYAQQDLLHAQRFSAQPLHTCCSQILHLCSSCLHILYAVRLAAYIFYICAAGYAAHIIFYGQQDMLLTYSMVSNICCSHILWAARYAVHIFYEQQDMLLTYSMGSKICCSYILWAAVCLYYQKTHQNNVYLCKCYAFISFGNFFVLFPFSAIPYLRLHYVHLCISGNSASIEPGTVAALIC